MIDPLLVEVIQELNDRILYLELAVEKHLNKEKEVTLAILAENLFEDDLDTSNVDYKPIDDHILNLIDPKTDVVVDGKNYESQE